jgi:SRSO17 transposase
METAMMPDDLAQWGDDFEAFHARFARFFKRSEPRQQAVKYVRGLMTPVQRKNGWQLAEVVGDNAPDKMQRLLYRSDWDVDGVRDELQAFVVERFGDAAGIGVVDETGFIKKGTHSVGVQRQYSGTAGKIENCQIGVFLTYRSSQGHTFLDRRLYLPKEWCDDSERRERAGVPEKVTFETKPDLAIAMLKHAWDNGVPMRWVVGDEIYGEAVKVRRTVEDAQRLYVFAVRSNTCVWPEMPAVIMPFKPTTGRPRTLLRLAVDAVPSSTVAAVAAAWPAAAWRRLSVADGAKGPLIYDWACARVRDSRDGVPGPECWLLARRSISDPEEIAYYLSNAPADTPLETLAWAASQRWSIEQCIEEGKGETGLDEYEVRFWDSWYRHVTLSMMAHAWLASVKARQVFPPGGPGSG